MITVSLQVWIFFEGCVDTHRKARQKGSTHVYEQWICYVHCGGWV